MRWLWRVHDKQPPDSIFGAGSSVAVLVKGVAKRLATARQDGTATQNVGKLPLTFEA